MLKGCKILASREVADASYVFEQRTKPRKRASSLLGEQQTRLCDDVRVRFMLERFEMIPKFLSGYMKSF
jgi:hypothetical protein